MEAMKCPQCGAPLEMQDFSNGMFRCRYCFTNIAMKENVQEFHGSYDLRDVGVILDDISLRIAGMDRASEPLKSIDQQVDSDMGISRAKKAFLVIGLIILAGVEGATYTVPVLTILIIIALLRKKARAKA